MALSAPFHGSLCDLAPLHALGVLDVTEGAAFEQHLQQGCAACADDRLAFAGLLGRLPAVEARAASPETREDLLELAQAPQLPIDPSGWDEVAPGIRVRVVKEDPARALSAYLIWAEPGARHPRHRHLGREVILVLKGRIFDGVASYAAGEICRSQPGSDHFEEAMAGEDCICYILSYGGLEMLDVH